MPLIPAPGRQRQADVCESNASLVYQASAKTGSKTTQRNPVLRGKKGRSFMNGIVSLQRGLREMVFCPAMRWHTEVPSRSIGHLIC